MKKTTNAMVYRSPILSPRSFSMPATRAFDICSSQLHGSTKLTEDMALAYIDPINERDGIQRAQNREQPPVDFADQLLLVGLNLLEAVGKCVFDVHIFGCFIDLLRLFHVFGVHAGLS